LDIVRPRGTVRLQSDIIGECRVGIAREERHRWGPMQKRKFIAALVAAVVMVEAGAASLSEDQLVACAGMADSAARLACFDREVAPLAREAAARARASSPAAPPPATVAAPATATPPAAAAAAPATATTLATTAAPATAAAPATTPAPSFGQEQLAREQRPAPEKEDPTLHARLTSQKSAGPGLFNLYLDNGQVWRHEDQVLGPYLKDGEAITIEKGALGGYKLTRDAGKSRNWIRVTRVR
jgi:hypothetical protein